MTVAAPEGALPALRAPRCPRLLRVLDAACAASGFAWVALALGVGPFESSAWFLPYVSPVAAGLLAADWVWRARRSGRSWLGALFFVPAGIALSTIGYINPGNFAVLGALTGVGPPVLVAGFVVVGIALASTVDRMSNAPIRVGAGLSAVALITIAMLGLFVLAYGEAFQDSGPVSRVYAQSGSVRVEEDLTPADARSDSLVLRSGSGPLRREVWLCATDGDPTTSLGNGLLAMSSTYPTFERRITFDPETLEIVSDSGGPPIESYYCT